MPNLDTALGRALSVLAESDTAIEKTIFSSPAGKKRLAKRLVAMLPEHSTYVEPFAGSAAILFAKDAAKVEVLNDADPEIVSTYRIVKRLRPEDFKKLEKFDWKGTKDTFNRLWKSTPKNDLEKLHKFLYLSRFSYGKMRGKGFSPMGRNVEARFPQRLAKNAPRLKNVHIFGGDYERVVRKFDSKNTLFFLDPPYAGYDAHVGEGKFDEQRFFKMLKSLKGKFLLTYGTRGELPKLVKSAGFDVRTIRAKRSIGLMRNVGGPKVLTTLVVSNYPITQKALDADEDFDLSDGIVDESSAFAATNTLIKGIDPGDERFVLGVVLEPEVVDAQGDIYSADEIRNAAHKFMEDFQGLGLQHQESVAGDVKILESYLAPDDIVVGDVALKKGTWLLGVHVLSDELWSMVKDGSLTGFSIGGTARKVPVDQPTA